ncbi:MAG: PD40 domain-containing protein [Chitinophagales bacterium]|nr:PD40 domain-containing protein [Chitinophagales bacterium]
MNRFFLFFVLLLLLSCKKTPIHLITKVTTFREHGLDVSWDQSGSNRIAYSMKGADGYYDIYLAQPDGSNDTCLTCNHPLLPNKHIANMAWHPSGKWLVAVVEEAAHAGSSADALPGFGAYCDIWLISDDASKAFMLVDIPSDYDHGVICPRFSNDGKQLVWTDRKAAPNILDPKKTAGYWTIKLADFVLQGDTMPVVSNIRTLEPDGDAFYEVYGFSPDNSRLIFCSNMNKPSFWDEHIYTMDTTGNDVKKLTDKDYNEHGFYSPDGSKIVWMSNTNSSKGGTDWWQMNTDGSNKKRLTYFNEQNNEQSAANAVWAGLGSFSPDGKRFVGGVQLSLVTQEGKIVMVDLLE